VKNDGASNGGDGQAAPQTARLAALAADLETEVVARYGRIESAVRVALVGRASGGTTHPARFQPAGEVPMVSPTAGVRTYRVVRAPRSLRHRVREPRLPNSVKLGSTKRPEASLSYYARFATGMTP
jgi:hypothetical protein